MRACGLLQRVAMQGACWHRLRAVAHQAVLRKPSGTTCIAQHGFFGRPLHKQTRAMSGLKCRVPRRELQRTGGTRTQMLNISTPTLRQHGEVVRPQWLQGPPCPDRMVLCDQTRPVVNNPSESFLAPS